MKRVFLDALILLALPVFCLQQGKWLQAEWFYRQGEKAAAPSPEQALAWYEQAAAVLPEHALYQRAVGRACLQLYDPKASDLKLLRRAWRAYQEVLRLDPVYPYGWFETGRVLEAFRLAGITSGEDPGFYFRHAVACDPTNPLFLAGLIHWEASQGNQEAAWRLFPQLLHSQPSAVHPLGDELLRTPQDRERLSRELGREPEVNVEYAQYLVRRGELELAAKQAERLTEAYWLLPDLAAPMAEVLIALKQTEPARQRLTRALEETPSNLRVAFTLAKLLEQQGDLPGALAVYLKQLPTYPNYWILHAHVAMVAQKNGDLGLARQHYQKILDDGHAPKDHQASVHNALAGILTEQGDLRGALAEYRKALQLLPGHPGYTAQLQKIQAQLERAPSGPAASPP